MDYGSLPCTDFVKMVISNRDLCPCLMVGEYVNAFKQTYSDVIERVYTLKDVKRVVEEYDGIESVNSGFLVLEGIGNLSDVGQNSLLKFIEDSRLSIILLSYNDKISPIIMSRMKVVVKRWKAVESLDFSTVMVARRYLDEKQKKRKMDEFEETQEIANICPRLYAVMSNAGDPFGYYNRRMIDLVYSNYPGGDL